MDVLPCSHSWALSLSTLPLERCACFLDSATDLRMHSTVQAQPIRGPDSDASCAEVGQIWLSISSQPLRKHACSTRDVMLKMLPCNCDWAAKYR